MQGECLHKGGTVIYKRGKTYWYQFQIDGKRIRASAKTTNRQVALQREAARRLACANGRGVSKRNLGKFQDVFAEFLVWAANHVKPRTHQRYGVSGKRLGAFFANERLHEVDTARVAAFTLERSRECSNAGLNRDLACIRTFLNWCIRMGYLAEKPYIKLLPEGPGNMRIVSHEEERAYLDQADSLLADVATIMVETGMRPGEVFAIRGNHVNLEARYVFVPSGKTKFARRTIPLTLRANGAVARRMPISCRQCTKNGLKMFAIGSYKDDPGLLFPAKAAHQIVMRRHKAICKRLGLDFRLYDFRHTYGSRMAMAGVDLMTLRELMGHSSITITQRYCHPTPEHKLAAVAKLVEYNEAATKKPQSQTEAIQ
jgi:integrase